MYISWKPENTYTIAFALNPILGIGFIQTEFDVGDYIVRGWSFLIGPISFTFYSEKPEVKP